MNQHINALLGPLEAATRSESWEDAEDIAREISRLARMERLKELQRIQEALIGRGAFAAFHAGELLEKLKDSDWTAKAKAAGWDAEELRKTALEALPAAPPAPIMQGESTLILSSLTTPEPSWGEQWPFG